MNAANPCIGRRVCERAGGSMQMLCRFELVRGRAAYRQTRYRCSASVGASRLDAHSFAPVSATRQIVPQVSSATSSEPSFRTAGAAGRPHTSPPMLT